MSVFAFLIGEKKTKKMFLTEFKSIYVPLLDVVHLLINYEEIPHIK